VLLDFCDARFFEKDTGRRFDTLAFADAPKVWSWTPPGK
jgi:hypothetical protein